MSCYEQAIKMYYMANYLYFLICGFGFFAPLIAQKTAINYTDQTLCLA